jgi:hypothetical protein
LKISEIENQELSKAIDQMTEGLDAFIELYNESEVDAPIIQWTEANVEKLKKANEQFGEKLISKKINNIVNELLELLPLDEDSKE